MQKERVDMFLALKAEYFNPIQLSDIRNQLEAMDDDKFVLLSSMELRNPTTILVIAIVLGWERFFLDDIGLGLLKVLTCYGCGIWWLIDILSAKKRAQDYNYKKFIQFRNLM